MNDSMVLSFKATAWYAYWEHRKLLQTGDNSNNFWNFAYVCKPLSNHCWTTVQPLPNHCKTATYYICNNRRCDTDSEVNAIANLLGFKYIICMYSVHTHVHIQMYIYLCIYSTQTVHSKSIIHKKSIIAKIIIDEFMSSRDRCYDFFKFRRKIRRKKRRFWLKKELNNANFWS
jgi:hypothetical protein